MPENPEATKIVADNDGGIDEHYFIALAMLLDMRGGSFVYTEPEYELFKAKQGGQAQIIVSQRDDHMRFELTREGRRDH